MPTKSNTCKYEALVLAVATGQSVAEFCRATKTAKSTAASWTSRPEFQDDVRSMRARVVDQAVGKLSESIVDAAGGIVKLSRNAQSEAVRLQALKSVFEHLVSLTTWAEVVKRLDQLEKRDPS